MKSTREQILYLLEREGPIHAFGIYKRLKEDGCKARYGTIRWTLLFLKNEELVRVLPPQEVQDLNLQVEPNRSGRSWTRPWLKRSYYDVF